MSWALKTAESNLGGFFIAQNEARSACCASADLSMVGCCLLAQILALYLNQYILNPFENSDRLFNFVLAVIVWSAN